MKSVARSKAQNCSGSSCAELESEFLGLVVVQPRGRCRTTDPSPFFQHSNPVKYPVGRKTHALKKTSTRRPFSRGFNWASAWAGDLRKDKRPAGAGIPMEDVMTTKEQFLKLADEIKYLDHLDSDDRAKNTRFNALRGKIDNRVFPVGEDVALEWYVDNKCFPGGNISHQGNLVANCYRLVEILDQLRG